VPFDPRAGFPEARRKVGASCRAGFPEACQREEANVEQDSLKPAIESREANMSKLLRHYSGGNIYFITTITRRRSKILVEYHDLFWDSLLKFKKTIDFDIVAYVILPDHVHLIIDPRGGNPSDIMMRVKFSFSKKVRFESSQHSNAVWQSRFWDHMIRDQGDLNRHIDYIHYNPVKHGYVTSPFEWEHSSIHEFFRQGYYASDWGVMDKIEISGEFGE
jgi:putative transposase